jgi:uncharacterized membrane protein YtjA (UPF0391 family)
MTLGWTIFVVFLALEVFLVPLVYFGYRRSRWADGTKPTFVFFSPQDYWRYLKTKKMSPDNLLPAESEKETFLPMLKQYFGLTKLLISIAAASIGFGGIYGQNDGIYHAKFYLAGSIAFGLLFSFFCLYFYESYQHGYEYKLWKATLVEWFGVTCLICFAFGYVVWVLNLNPPETNAPHKTVLSERGGSVRTKSAQEPEVKPEKYPP